MHSIEQRQPKNDLLLMICSKIQKLESEVKSKRRNELFWEVDIKPLGMVIPDHGDYDERYKLAFKISYFLFSVSYCL